MKRLLLTGASGFLGWNICNIAKQDWEIYGIVLSNPLEIPGVSTIQADLTDPAGLREIFSTVRPDAVIHTAAASDPNFCQENSAEAKKINVTASIELAGLCADAKIPFAFTSTDLVFDGLNVPYKEEDSVNPVNAYGEQKVLAEQGILTIYPDAAICRMPLMFGDPGPKASIFSDSMLKAMKERKELKLFTDEYRTPASGTTAAHGLFMALEKVHGIVHLGGRERVSRYELGLLMMDAYGISEARIIRTLQKDAGLSAPRPLDVSLDSTKAFSLGYAPLSVREELKRLASV